MLFVINELLDAVTLVSNIADHTKSELVTCSFHLAILSPIRRMTATEPRLAEIEYATSEPSAEH